ncbi:hypothetical protein [Arthrobacter sp. CAN_A1]|uniref:hypothetical protein n=1 Tax=Arthrobacter sp. CAN_A1 TaxID=2787717 RepID=UPI0018CAB419
MFDRYYNTEREHQALPSGTTPFEAWNATTIAEPPQPPAPETTTISPRRSVRRTANLNGEATVVGTRFKLGKEYIGQEIHVIYDDHTIMFFDSRGTEITRHQRPPRLTRYIGNNKPRGFMANQVSTKS